ncbi:hypothetical protein [Micrococcus endophyticus]
MTPESPSPSGRASRDRILLMVASLSWAAVFPGGLLAPLLIPPDRLAADAVPFVLAQGVLTALPLLGAVAALMIGSRPDRRSVTGLIVAALLAQAVASAGRVMSGVPPDGIGLVWIQWAGELALLACGVVALRRAALPSWKDRRAATSPPVGTAVMSLRVGRREGAPARGQTTPWAIIASATLMKPAMFAPAT